MRKILIAATLFLSLASQAQWLPQHPGFTQDTVGFYEFSLPDKNTAWTVCYDGRFGLLSGRPVLNFSRTIDGGNTWIPGKVGTDRSLRFSNISAIDGQEAWVAMHKMDYSTIPTLRYVGFGKGGGIFHTTDGGVSWDHTFPGELFDTNSTPQFVHFKDKNHGLAVGDPKEGYWEIYLTNNKGKKWKRVSAGNIPAPLPNERGWISGFAEVGDTIWFGTTAGRMYKSLDFGKTWTVHAVTLLPGTEVNEIAFLDDGLTGVAHLRNNSISRTYVFSTTDGGLTWTNYFQPANWKNSRVTAVPGTTAFVSTSTHPNPLFTGSSVSYDAGRTWTHIDQTAQKAACRFFDANTGYAGGFHVTGHPVLGTRGIFKSQIVFQDPSIVPARSKKTVSNINENMVRLYPVPARDVLNIVFEEAEMKDATVRIYSLDGKLMLSGKPSGRASVQLDVSELGAGVYNVQINTRSGSINKLVTITK